MEGDGNDNRVTIQNFINTNKQAERSYFFGLIYIFRRAIFLKMDRYYDVFSVFVRTNILNFCINVMRRNGA